MKALILDGVGAHSDSAKRASMIAAIDHKAPPLGVEGSHMRWCWDEVSFLWNAWAPGHNVEAYAQLLHQGMINRLEPRFGIRPMGAAFTPDDPNMILPKPAALTLILAADTDTDTVREGFEAPLAAAPGASGSGSSGVHPLHRPDGAENYAERIDAFLKNIPTGGFLHPGDTIPKPIVAGGDYNHARS